MYSDVNVEWRLLSTFLNQPESIYKTTREVFTDDRQDVFDRMLESYAKYGTISLDSLRLTGEVPRQLSIEYRGEPRVLIEQLVRFARRRQLFDAAQRLLAESGNELPDESRVKSALDFPAITPSTDIYLQTGYMKLQGEIAQKRSATYTFASTGLSALDSMMGAEYPRKSVIILKAKEGTGKTALVCSSMLYMAKQGIASHFWSMEMPKSTLLVRWLANELSIDNTEIQIGRNLSIGELSRINAAAVELQQLPMTVNENRVSIDEMITETHYLAGKGTRVFFVDYLQIANVFKYGNKNQDLGYFVQTCKDLAKRFDVTFVILSQVNDQQETRDTGEAEKIADISIYLEPDTADAVNDYKIINVRWDKNRLGKAGVTNAVLFNGSFQRYVDMGRG